MPIFAFLVSSGCWSQSNPADPSSLGGSGGEGSEVEFLPPGVKTAYHLLQASDLRASDWPSKYEGYDVFVCNASMDNGHLSTIRAAFPNAILLAGTNAQDAFIHVLDSPYYDHMEASFDSSHCVQNLDTDETVRIYPYDEEHPELAIYPFYVMSRLTAENLAGFHYFVTMQTDWDGLYIDMCTVGIPPWKRNALVDIAPNFDIDSDGEADTLEELDAQYAAWRPYFTQLLRIVMADKIIVANTNGTLDDPALNGITLERVGNRFPVPDAKRYFLSQRAVSPDPKISIAWVLSEVDEAPALEVAEDQPWVHYGFVRK